MQALTSVSHVANAPKILFFGQKNCKYSEQTHAFLMHLGFDVETVWSVNRTEKLPDDVKTWQGDYILCFRSYFLLPVSLIERAKIAAINFHPAPAEYPGSGCINWALYEDAKEYGVTAHIMNEKIDNGAIIECRRFPVFPQDTVSTLLARAHQKSFDLIVDIVGGIYLGGRDFLDQKILASSHEKWRGKARKMYEIDKLQIIPLDCSKEELDRIIRATDTPKFPPYIELHGHKFFLERKGI